MSGVPQINCPGCGASMPYTAASCPRCRRRMVGGLSKPARSQPYGRAEGTLLAALGPTPFIECASTGCHYFIGERDETCPDCGAPRPSPYVTADAELAHGNRGLFTILIFFGVLLPVAAFSEGRATPVGLFLAVIAAVWYFLSGFVEQTHTPDPAPPPGMRLNAHTALRRLAEIKQRQHQVKLALAHAGRGDAGRAAALREPLEAALETLRRQHALYSLKLFEVEAARWQNKLAPLIYGLDELTFAQNENRLKAAEAAGREGLALRERAEGLRALLGGREEFEEFARKLDETLASCEKIREALVGRQALLALKEVSPLEDALREQHAAALGPDGVEVFNLQVSLTDFSTSFDELEDEYRRLREEAEVGERMRRVLGG